MARNSVYAVSAAGCCCLIAGCGALIDIVRPNSVTVVLQNNGEFEVTAEVHISDTQEIPEDLLTETSEMVFNISPGAPLSFTRDCDDLQAIIINDADLNIIGEAGPETSTDVLRDSEEFRCGDTINFIFDHSNLVVDFNVTVRVDPGGPTILP